MKSFLTLKGKEFCHQKNPEEIEVFWFGAIFNQLEILNHNMMMKHSN